MVPTHLNFGFQAVALIQGQIYGDKLGARVFSKEILDHFSLETCGVFVIQFHGCIFCFQRGGLNHQPNSKVVSTHLWNTPQATFTNRL